VKSAEFRAERLRKGWPENPAKVGVVSELPYARAGLASAQEQRPQGRLLQNFLTPGSADIFLFTTRCTEPESLAAFETAGAKVHTMGQERVDLVEVFRSLHKEGIRSVLVEGGGTLIAELFRLDLVDELTIYIASKIFGGSSAPTLADGPGFLPNQAPSLELKSVENIDDEGGILAQYIVNHKE
jgi:riboflavin-specific deaminase-like protein